MKTSQETYLEFLSKPHVRMAIPVFQRVYTWGVWQCDELFEDILHAGKSQESHFIGSIVYTREEIASSAYSESDLSAESATADNSDDAESATAQTGDVPAVNSSSAASVGTIAQTGGKFDLFNIVDGQQRTTTTYLLLIALRDHLRDAGGTVCSMSAEDIEDTYLYMQAQASTGGAAAAGSETESAASNSKARLEKFIAAPADKATLAAILNKTDMPENYLISKCVVDNYNYFKDMLTKVNLDDMWRGLNNLFAIVVELGSTDNPQLIFEGINSKGMSLATSDLLRNRMFFEQDKPTQERLLVRYWEPLEALFEDDPTQNHFNAAIRRWLVEQDSTLENRSRWELYSVFRKYIDTHYPNNTEALMKELLESCTEFKHMIKSPPMRKHLDWAEGHTEFNGASGHTMFG